MRQNRTITLKTMMFLALMLTASFPSLLLQPAAASRVSDSPKIDAALTAEIASHEDGTMLPVFVEFQDGTGSETMLEAITKSVATGFVVRHVFHLIPVVSLYATGEAILKLAGCIDVEALGLDRKWQALELGIESTSVDVATSMSYEGPEDIMNADILWSQGYNGSGVKVAIIDSGVQSTHPDLQKCLVGFRDFIGGHDDMDPSNGITGYDDNGHGTACAWLVAGSGQANGGLFKGIAPGASLLIEKALQSDGTGDDSVIAQAIEFAVDHNAAVISMSLGGRWQDSATTEPSVLASRAAVAAGVTVVVAAGNSGPAPFSVNSPAIAEEVITVGASIGRTAVVAFSSRGPVDRTRTQPVGLSAKPDIVAPGYRIVSGRASSASAIEYPLYNSSDYGTNYAVWSGTSASTPEIAGVLALLMSKHIGLTPIEAKAFLMAGATDLGEDSMAQGYGLANATKSSELIQATSRIISIVTPRTYPTLPGSDHVYVVGDQRDRQIVCVISTATRGQVSIVTSGNASAFVNTTLTSLAVAPGYSHFGLSLKVPEGLPLSAIGHYSGNLTLVSGNTTIASMELNMQITTYGGRLLVDMVHHASNDIDYPSYFRYFAQYLREQGVELSEYGNPTAPTLITSGGLSAAETFMIMDTEMDYAKEEIDALHTFVDNGGTLLILSEFYDNTTAQASFAIDSYNEILAPYGIQCERFGIGLGPDNMGVVCGVDHNGSVESNPLMDGVKNLYILIGSTLSVNASVSGAQGLFWYDAAKKHAIVATATHGRGKVIAVSDGSTLYDDVLYDAIQSGADNLRLLRNIALAVVPQMPRIYEVVFNHGHLGEKANVTTYVFDEDLDNVTIRIVRPDGFNITGSVVESLGYTFTTSFTLTSGGFYGVVVIASDKSGNTMTYQSIVLIPIDAAEDTFIQTVVYVLLGVVLIGLAYVGALKFGLGRRVGKKLDKGWEVPMQGGESPPSIQ